MKEIITTITKNTQKKNVRFLGMAAGGALGLMLLFGAVYQPADGDPSALKTSPAPEAVEVGTVGEEETLITDSGSNNSWPGEIISSEISQVQPQREGVLVEWKVSIGQTVREGQILGKISAPPATPELIKMLAEQKEALARAEAQITATEDYVAKERERLAALTIALDGGSASNDSVFQSLARLREMVETEKKALRIFVEQSLNSQVITVSSASTWRSFKVGMMDKEFGALDQIMQHTYETTLASFIEELKNSPDVQIGSARAYYALAVRIANATPNGGMATEFKAMAKEDQTELSKMIAAYQTAVAELADMETEYRIMISEKNAMLDRERTMASADVVASRSAYATVAGQITGSVYITAPRSGTVSAIYKKVGDLVAPDMSLAIVAGSGKKDATIRMKIPSNIQKPKVGELLSVVRPGFPNDIRKAKLIGIGSSLDGSGSYMADAVLVDPTDWPIDSSVRVFGSKDSQTITVPSTSLWWDESGSPMIWAVSPGDRIYSKKISIGRAIGDRTEVYSGLSVGEKYLKNPSHEIKEDMFLSDLVKESFPLESSTSNEADPHAGHNMEGM